MSLPYLAPPITLSYAELDKLVWVAGFTISPYGARLGIRVSQMEALVDVCDLIPEAWRTQTIESGAASDEEAVDIFDDTQGYEAPCELIFSLKIGEPSKRRGSRNYHLLYANDLRLERSLDFSTVLLQFRLELLMAVAGTAETHCIMPGVVMLWNERTLLFPGHLVSKTLLSPFLTQGATIYSQDFVCLGEAGAITPWPGPPGTCRTELDNPVCVYMTQDLDSGQVTRIQKMSPGQSCLMLFGITISAALKPNFALPLLTRWSQCVEVFRCQHSGDVSSGQDLVEHYRGNFWP